MRWLRSAGKAWVGLNTDREDVKLGNQLAECVSIESRQLLKLFRRSSISFCDLISGFLWLKLSSIEGDTICMFLENYVKLLGSILYFEVA